MKRTFAAIAALLIALAAPLAARADRDDRHRGWYHNRGHHTGWYHRPNYTTASTKRYWVRGYWSNGYWVPGHWVTVRK